MPVDVVGDIARRYFAMNASASAAASSADARLSRSRGVWPCVKKPKLAWGSYWKPPSRKVGMSGYSGLRRLPPSAMPTISPLFNAGGVAPSVALSSPDIKAG